MAVVVKSWLIVVILLIILLITGGAAAQNQDDEGLIDDIIAYDQPVSGTITEAAIFDVWRFQANAGDVVLVQMQAADGLAPLIGIRDRSGNVISSTEVDYAGEPLPPAEPNSMVTLEFHAPQSGEYAIVATRVGRLDGTTQGSYTLILRRLDSQTINRQAVEFRCGTQLVRTVATLEFTPGQNEEDFRVQVYGIDGFEPAIGVVAGLNRAVNECAADPAGAEGDTVIWETEMTVEPESPHAAAFTIGGGELLQDVTLTLASKTPGRYMAIITGFTLLPQDGEDQIMVRIGPSALGTEMRIYMVKLGSSRLDPVIVIPEQRDELEFRCDDAGRFACADVPSIAGFGAVFADGQAVIGSSLDAGVRLQPDDVERIVIELTSTNPNASGDYALVIFGELPQIGE
ncbi:MAG: hypothetical protein Kow00117_16880 [Phototrophicales bacterium]